MNEISHIDVIKLIENQKTLQNHVPGNKFLNTEELLTRFSTAIFVECGEAITETDFKWWKAVKVNIDKLVGEMADVFIFALDLTLLIHNEKIVYETLEVTNTSDYLFDVNDYTLMISRLKVLGSVRLARVYGTTYGIEIMKGILELANTYGYTNFADVVLAKQKINIERQLNGYNKFKVSI